MARTRTILGLLASAWLLAIVGCHSNGSPRTISDADDWFSDGTKGARQGMAISDAEESWASWDVRRRASEATSISRAENRFSRSWGKAADSMSIGEAHDRVMSNSAWQRLLDAFSLGNANDEINRLQGR